jgi:predicted amino acid dehydrogenase
VLVDQDAEQTLVAFLEPSVDTPTIQDLQTFLRGKLPEYMRPHRFQVMQSLPLKPNGKVDRGQLTMIARSGPVAALTTSTGEGGLPLSASERMLAGIWRNVLEVPVVHREDDFFAIGGDSLNILQVLVSLEERGFTVNSAAELYQHRTLADQARILTPLDARTRQRSIGSDPQRFPLSPAQTGFLMARAITPSLAATWSAYFWLEGELDVSIFNKALQRLAERHPMLRTVCLTNERPPLQQEITPERPLTVRYEELDPDVAKDPDRLHREISNRLKEESQQPFDLSRWPLIRMRLCRLQAGCHVWFVSADHFMGDAFSGWIFATELFELYDALLEGKAAELPSLQSTFREYVPLALERESVIDDETAAFWKLAFREPYQAPIAWRQGDQNQIGEEEWLHEVGELAVTQFAALKRRAAAHGQTAHDTLLALFYRRLVSLTGQADLVVGTAVAGRDYPLPDLMRIFGSFATLLPIRMNLSQPDDIEHQVQGASHLVGKALAHKRTPRQIARLAGAEVPLPVLTGLQFLFSFMDFEKLRNPTSRHLTIRWDLSQTELQPPRLGTDIVLSARALAGRLRLTFTAGQHAMTQPQLSTFAADFQSELEKLLETQHAGEHRPPRIRPLDAALVAYLPPTTTIVSVMDELGIRAEVETIRSMLCPAMRPRPLVTSTNRLGRTATICIPVFADELDDISLAKLSEVIVEAGRIARSAGAQCVSLAGMLPSKTRYGYAVMDAMAHGPSFQVTTGHSLTVVTVVKNVQHVIREAGYTPRELSIAFLGVGSVGGSVLALYLSQADHPRRILLCDVAASQGRLEKLAGEIRHELCYTGELQIVLSHGQQVPSELYTAHVIVGAASQPDILDVARLPPGTLVIDDSFPNCFDAAAAVDRMETQKDVLLVGAGLLDCGPVQTELHLPPLAPPSARRILDYLPSVGSPGCQMEALLKVLQPDLPLTHGLVTLETARAYWQAAEALDLRAPKLHLGNKTLDPSLLKRLKWLRQGS